MSAINKELEKIISDKGGKIVVGFKNPTVPITISCSAGHEFSELYRNIKSGSWCPDCIGSHGSVAIKKIRDFLEREGFDARRKEHLPSTSYSFDLAIENEGIIMYIDYDDDSVFTEKDKQDQIISKVNTMMNRPKCSCIRVDKNCMTEQDMEQYIWDSIMDPDKRLHIPDLQKYLWLVNKVIEKKEEKKVDKTILGPCSEIIEGGGEPLEDLKMGKFAIIGYCRVSTQEQAQQGISLQTQVDKIKQLSALKGYPLVKIYVDKGLSGKQLSSRPAMMKVLEDLKPGYYLAVYSLSRLARNNRQAIEILDKIREKGAYLVSLDYDIDTRTSIGQLIYNVLSALSQFEADQISERVTSNMNHLAKLNKLRSRPPFGFDFVGKNLPFVRNEKEQGIIEYIRKLREDNNGMTCTSIANSLNDRGLTTKRGKKFYQNTVRKIMEDNNMITRKGLEDRVKARKRDDEVH